MDATYVRQVCDGNMLTINEKHLISGTEACTCHRAVSRCYMTRYSQHVVKHRGRLLGVNQRDSRRGAEGFVPPCSGDRTKSTGMTHHVTRARRCATCVQIIHERRGWSPEAP